MIITEQLLSFIISILYGFFYFFTLKISYNYLYCKKKIYKMLNSFLFQFLHTIIYFKIYYFVNFGQVNVYFIIITIIVYFMINIKFTKNMSN